MPTYQNQETFTPTNVAFQTDKTGQIPEHISAEILTEVQRTSVAMQLGLEVPVSSPLEKQISMSGVSANWVGEGQAIPTAKPTFSESTLESKKIAVIIASTQENLKWGLPNFFELVKPQIVNAFNKAIDSATFSGKNSPFTNNILSLATTAGNVITETSNAYDDINKALGMLEANDFEANAIASVLKQKQIFRGTKDTNGYPIFNEATRDVPADILGTPTLFLRNDTFGDEQVAEILGDWNYLNYGLLQNIEFKLSDVASVPEIVDSNGQAFSAFANDGIVLRATMYYGFNVTDADAFSVVAKAATPPTP